MTLFRVWLLWIVFTSQALAWNALGHRLIAEIASDHLTPSAKAMCRSLQGESRYQNIVSASTWLDDIRFKKDVYYDSMHYVDIPFSNDHSPLPPIPEHNAISCVQSAVRVLSSQTAKRSEKTVAMRELLHVVGDIHQPLHAATEISAQYPQGDLGGNRVLLSHNAVANNLHAYWDRGAGFLVRSKRSKSDRVRHLALDLERRWPCHPLAMDRNPTHWAQESHDLAKRIAYALPVDEHYQRIASDLVQQRVALAGCRLAGLLNHIAEITY